MRNGADVRGAGWRRAGRVSMVTLVVVGAGVAASAGWAAGGGGGGGGDADSTTCPRGEVYNAGARQCVRARAGLMNDEALEQYAYVLAKKEQRYDEALDVLDLVADKDTPRYWNYRGYATRKLGRLDEGIGYYLKSVALDPTYTQVREYLGEAYVTKGRLDLAQAELDTIAKLAGKDVEEYEDLAEAIAASATTQPSKP